MAATRQTTLAARLQARTLHPGLAALFGAPWASFGVGAAPRSTLFLARMLVRAFRMVYAVPPMGKGSKIFGEASFSFFAASFLGKRGAPLCAAARAACEWLGRGPWPNATRSGVSAVSNAAAAPFGPAQRASDGPRSNVLNLKLCNPSEEEFIGVRHRLSCT